MKKSKGNKFIIGIQRGSTFISRVISSHFVATNAESEDTMRWIRCKLCMHGCMTFNWSNNTNLGCTETWMKTFLPEIFGLVHFQSRKSIRLIAIFHLIIKPCGRFMWNLTWIFRKERRYSKIIIKRYHFLIIRYVVRIVVLDVATNFNRSCH